MTNARRNARLTDLGRQLRQVRNVQAAQRVAVASDAAVVADGLDQIDQAIDGGGNNWPLATTAQTLSGAVNELHGEIVALGTGGGGGGGGSTGGSALFDLGGATATAEVLIDLGGAA